MAPKRPKSVESRIHEHSGSFSESERKLAEVILSLPGDLSALSVTEISAMAGVSKATGTRFFRTLGYSSFEEARRQARDRQNWGSPLYLEDRSSAHHIELRGYISLEVQLLQQTLSRIDYTALQEAAEAIAAARRVWIVGFRNSQFLGNYLRWQILQFRGDVQSLPLAGETFGEYTVDFTEQDLVIGIGLRRRPKQLRQILQQAKLQNSRRLIITDYTSQSLPDLATWSFQLETRSPMVFDSSIAALSLLRLIAISAFQSSGKPGRAHMERLERQHEILGDLE